MVSVMPKSPCECKELEKKKPWTPKREPAWKIMGFKSKKEMQEFESRPDFPGWDAL
jgi:hypothetical protein